MSPVDFSYGMKVALGVTMGLYVAAMYALSVWAQGKIHNTEDFLVAGRRLPLSLAWMTLLATWFGAGTLLTAADEVRHRGVEGATLDPFGAGLCLILAGWLIARPMWQMGILTVSDFFRQKYGTAAELISACFLVPSYFGWIATQFVALAGVLELFFGLDPAIGIFLVAMVGMGYTLLGGMWSVTLTDALQITLLLVGLIVLAGSVLDTLGGGSIAGGLVRLVGESPAERLRPIPTESFTRLFGWFSVLCVGALGNLPGQDLMQRIFAAKSVSVARRACFIAGAAYLLFGLIPIGLGLAANLLFPEDIERAILPAMAHAFLHPAMLIIFTVALMSAVLSTIDSAILSPASVLAQNVLEKVNRGRLSSLLLNRAAIVLVTAGSLWMAYLGESAYSLLEGAYELMLVGLFVPLMIGIYAKPQSSLPAIACMLAAGELWLMHYLFEWDYFYQTITTPRGWEIPASIAVTAVGLVVYLTCDLLLRMFGVYHNGEA